MTLARTASYGLGTPPPLYRWIEAVLMLFAELVSNLASMFKTSNELHASRPILRDDRLSAIPQDVAGERSTESRPTFKHTSTEALILRGFAVVRVADELVRGTNSNGEARSREAIVSKDEGALTALNAHTILSLVIPAAARKREEREPRSYTHDLGHKPLASGPRATRASGMTPLASLKVRAQ